MVSDIHHANDGHQHPDQGADHPAAFTRDRIPLVPLGLALSIFLAISFGLCALGGLVPGLEGLHFLSALYPDIDWARPELIVAGMAWSFGVGWYTALVFGSIYNAFAPRRR